MAYQLSFTNLFLFDAGLLGIELPIVLRSGQQFVSLNAKLDTGASHCIFERIHGEVLGLDIESGLPITISTATGSFNAFGHAVTLSVEQFDLDVMVYFAQLYSFRRNVLGRFGFLQLVRIGLIDYDGKLYLSHRDDEIEMRALPLPDNR